MREVYHFSARVIPNPNYSRRTRKFVYKPTEKDARDWKIWLDKLKTFYKEYKISNNSKSQASPVFSKMPLDNRPYINFNVFGHELIALLDSGANQSIVGEGGIALLEKFNLKIDKTFSSHIETADGVPQLVTGSVYLPICLEKVCRLIKLLVVPSLKHSIILGSDFCKAFMLKINFQNDTWQVQVSDGSTNYDITNKTGIQENCYSLSLNANCLNDKQQAAAQEVINLFKDIDGKSRLGCTDKLLLEIDTGDAKPFKVRQYPMSPFMLEMLNKELDEMLRLNVIEPSHSSWNSPVLLVKKKSGEYRFCFDGRRLNSVTKRDAYPLPRVDRILSMLRDAKFISSIDLRKAFWQIPLCESSREKTAFSVPGRGLFHFKVVPFGLINSAQCQQRLMDAVFGPKLEPKVFCYLDDIIVTSSSFEEHLQILREVFERLRAANLTVNLEKCQFFKSSLKYLGFVVDGNGLRTDPDKVSSMINYPRPKTTTEIKRFIGMTSWYRKFICHFSTLVAPLNDLIKAKKKNQSIVWTPEAEASFVKLKEALVSAPILRSPDFSKQFTIQCDASDTGLGGILTQNINDEEVVVAFASRSLSRTERNYSVTEKECLAVIFSIEKFRPYIEGTRFTVITDHFSLLWLNRLKEPTGKLARWAVKLQQFNYDLVHRKGKLNVVPDALSRMPLPQVSEVSVNLDNLDNYYVNFREKIRKNPQIFPHFQVKNDLVYKHTPKAIALRSNVAEWKLLVPKYYRTQIIASCHDPPTSAHFGFYKTFHKVQDRYYWPKMRHDILKYVRSCKVCAAQKFSTDGPAGLMGSEKNVRFPFQILAVDIMGPFPRSKHGNCYLLVAADWFTKYTLLHPMRKATAENIVKFIENNVFLSFGVPQFIIVDNGTQFAGSKFKELAKKYNVQKIWYNARYHAQCNYVERINRTIGTAIRSYVTEHKDWDSNISKIQFAINSAKHEVTGFAPSFLNFARYVPLSGDYYGRIHTTENIALLPENRDDYSNDFKSISEICNTVKANLRKAYERNSKTYNLRRHDVTFNVGEKVWRRNKVLSDASNYFSAKLAPKYVLCRIRKKVSRLVYSLENMNGSDAGEWHVQDLKRYFGSNSDVSVD